MDLIGDLLGAGPRGGGGNGVTGSVFGKDQLKVESKEEKKMKCGLDAWKEVLRGLCVSGQCSPSSRNDHGTYLGSESQQGQAWSRWP